MTIDEAIEILELYMKPSDDIEPVDFDNAILLGIEALKVVEEQRTAIIPIRCYHLPGETEK